MSHRSGTSTRGLPVLRARDQLLVGRLADPAAIERPVIDLVAEQEEQERAEERDQEHGQAPGDRRHRLALGVQHPQQRADGDDRRRAGPASRRCPARSARRSRRTTWVPPRAVGSCRALLLPTLPEPHSGGVAAIPHSAESTREARRLRPTRPAGRGAARAGRRARPAAGRAARCWCGCSPARSTRPTSCTSPGKYGLKPQLPGDARLRGRRRRRGDRRRSPRLAAQGQARRGHQRPHRQLGRVHGHEGAAGGARAGRPARRAGRDVLRQPGHGPRHDPATCCGSRAGEWLLQSAAGGELGKMVIRLGKKYGFRTLNVVRRREQVEELKKLGADAVIVESDGPMPGAGARGSPRAACATRSTRSAATTGSAGHRLARPGRALSALRLAHGRAGLGPPAAGASATAFAWKGSGSAPGRSSRVS